jgi:YhcH/YjgK/YiaL family protein
MAHDVEIGVEIRDRTAGVEAVQVASSGFGGRIDENDVVFYSDPDLYGQVLLREGDLIVVAPEDAHKPRCAAGAPAPVKKVVVKVKI